MDTRNQSIEVAQAADISRISATQQNQIADAPQVEADTAITDGIAALRPITPVQVIKQLVSGVQRLLQCGLQLASVDVPVPVREPANGKLQAQPGAVRRYP